MKDSAYIEFKTYDEKSFIKTRDQRKAKYKDFESVLHSDRHVIECLNRDGIAILRNKCPVDKINRISIMQNNCIDKCIHLMRPRDLRNYTPDQHLSTVDRLDYSELKKGEKYYGSIAQVIDIDQPLLVDPQSILDVALLDGFVDTITEYLGCLPALCYVKLRRSFVNDLSLFDTQLFHVDGGTFKPIKILLYLNDVDENGGPFTYVKRSHKDKFDGWHEKDRWTEAELSHIYGSDSIIKACGSPGDAIIVDNYAFHCGIKPIKKDRNVLILTYLADAEQEGNTGAARPMQISKDYCESLSPKAQAILDLMEKV